MQNKNKFEQNWLSDLEKIITREDKILFLCSNSSSSRGLDELVINKFGKQIIGLINNIPSMPDIEYLKNVKFNFLEVLPSHIVALGGGSVIDVAKVVKLLLIRNYNYDLDNLENIDLQGDYFQSKLIAIPTTCGSGSESTHFATIWDRKNKVKKSASHAILLPDHVILDPELLYTLSDDNLFYSALDAISHSIESIWSKKSDDFSKSFAIKSLIYSNEVFENFPNYRNQINYQKLLKSSNFAGQAINITKTAIAHSISYPMTIHYRVPHGLAASFSIPIIFDTILKNLEISKPNLEIVQSAISNLNKFKLSKHISKYCNASQILELVPQMYNPQRAFNCIIDFDEYDLRKVINESLN